MYQIKNSQGQFDGIESLEKHILEVSQKHKDDKRAFAFALIVCDFNNPHIYKILNDTGYYNALDYVSGKTITVFYVNSDYLSHQSQKAKESNSVLMEFGIQKVNGPANLSPKFLAESLINIEYLPSPSILFFNISNYVISDFTIAQLRENEIEKGFNELIKVIQIAVDSLEQVQEEYRANETEIFNLLKQSIDGSEFWKNAKSGFSKAMKVKDFLFFWRI